MIKYNRNKHLLFFCFFVSIVGCLPSAPTVSDPKISFEEKIAGFSERIASSVETEPSVTLIGTKYDIKKTDSIVTPYAAVVTVEYELAMPPLVSLKERVKYFINFAYQDGEWSDGELDVVIGDVLTGAISRANSSDELSRASQSSKAASEAIKRLNVKVTEAFKGMKKNP